MSWHYNHHQDYSIIKELLGLLDENGCVEVFMDNGDILKITSENDVQIGLGAMMISSNNRIFFINTDKIVYFELIRSNKKTPISMSDSEGE